MLPDPDRWNHAVQQVLGRDEFGPAELETRVELAGRHFEAFVRAGVADSDAGLREDARIVELGTGWHPAVPILMHLLGAEQVQSVDHVDHTSDEKIHATVRGLADRMVDGSLRTALPAIRQDRCDRLVELAGGLVGRSGLDVLADLHVVPVVSDIRALDPDGAADAVISNLVLEHIPRDAMASVLRAGFGLCRPGGLMSHIIDMCDHGSYVDPALSQFNFLRFGERRWRLVGNDIQHENRLRLSQILDLYEEAGVPAEVIDERRGDWSDLARIPIAEPFRHMDPDDLRVIMAHVVSVRS